MNTLHIISHTHWDREWYRTFQQFRMRLIHLVDGVLDLLDHNPDFRSFMLDGQTIVLDDYLQIRPEREADLRAYIQSGRLTIGPWHILPDEFLVSPEATIRNLLEGERTSRRFGPRMPIGYIPDPFGHIGQMPQILNGFGIQSACVQRGLSDEPCEFIWQSPDGSQVLMAYLRDGYGNAASLPTSDPEHFTAEVKRLRDNLVPHSSAHDFLLMLGTDHMEPPADTTRAIESTRGKLDGDLLIHSSLADYIAAIQASVNLDELPLIQGELRDCKRSHLLPGVLSTRMRIKQRNQACETLLEKWAEPFSTFASLAIQYPPADMLREPTGILHQAWRLLMENHPHDSICGCSIDQVHDEMKVRFDQVDQIGEEITRQSLEGLAGLIDTGSSPAVIVFNPSGHARIDRVEATVESKRRFDLVDPAGNRVPYQMLGIGSQELIHVDLKPRELQALYANVPDGRIMGMKIIGLKIDTKGKEVNLEAVVTEQGEPDVHIWQEGIAAVEKLINEPKVEIFHISVNSADRTRIVFPADVAGLGWKAFSMQPRPEEKKPVVKINPAARFLLPLIKVPFIQRLVSHSSSERAPYRIENGLLGVAVEPDGTLTIHDQEHGNTFRGMNCFLDGGDCGDEYNYCPPPRDRVIQAQIKKVSIERGDVVQNIRVEMILPTPNKLTPDRKSREKSTQTTFISTTVSLTKGASRVDIHTEIQNPAGDHRLRVHFPAPYGTSQGIYDGHFDVLERPIGIPEFDQSWVEQPRPEVPQRAFAAVTDGRTGLVIANRGLPEVEILKNSNGNSEIALTLLRCISWLSRDDYSNRKNHAGPAMATPGAQMIGTWAFDYAIIPAGSDMVKAYHQAYAFEAPLRSMTSGSHPGILPTSGTFAEISPDEFILSTLKQTEDKKGWILRGYNISDQEIPVTIRSWRRFNHAGKANLAEELQETLHPNENGEVQLTAGAHEIVTLRLWD